jgi:N-acetylglucosamine malate deacetylase 1
MTTQRLLVLSPHADDAELGAGGFIARTVAEAGDVCVALMTVGQVKFRHRGTVMPGERMREFTDSMGLLGVDRVNILSRGLDGKMYTAPQCEFVAKLDDLIDDFKPTQVLIPLPSSHQDHRYAYEVGIAATRPSAAKHQPGMIAAYEYPSSNWGDGAEANPSKGGMYVNVSVFWRHKMDALNCYASQMRGPHHLFSTAGVDALGTMRGLESGCQRAELFHVLRMTI